MMTHRKSRFTWTQAMHNAYQKAVDGNGGPRATTVAGIIKSMPQSDMELISLDKKQLSRRLWSYLQRDRERERDAAVQERRALYAQNAAHAPGTHEPTSAEGTLAAAAVTPMRAPKRRRTEPAPPDETTVSRNPGRAGESSAQGAACMAALSARTAAVAASGDAPPAARGPAPAEGNTADSDPVSDRPSGAQERLPRRRAAVARRRDRGDAEPRRLGVAAIGLVAALLRVPHGEHLAKLMEWAYHILGEGFGAASSEAAIALPGRVADGISNF